MNDLRKEFITFLKQNGLYVKWLVSFKSGDFKECPPQLFFERIEPFCYVSVVLDYRNKYNYSKEMFKWLFICTMKDYRLFDGLKDEGDAKRFLSKEEMIIYYKIKEKYENEYGVIE